MHDGDPVGNRQGFFLVVGDIHRGNAHLLLDVFDGVAHLHTQLGVQVGQGFVHQQHLGMDDDGPGQGHALLLAAGELGGHAVFQVTDLHHVQDLRHGFFDFRLGHMALP